MIRLSLLLLLLFTSLPVLVAQTGNGWINFNQPYVKIPVGKDAIYRVSAAEISSVESEFMNADVGKLQLYHRGNEQAIIVKDDGNGIFDAADYIEFFGRKNDGTLDANLYQSASIQPQPYYNLFSDTTFYFVTVGTANGKRANEYDESNSGLEKEAYHYQEKVTPYAESYSLGKDYGEIFLTVFDECEGWMSEMILYNQAARIFSIAGLINTVPSAEKPLLEISISGRGPKDHPVQISAGDPSRVISDVSIIGFTTTRLQIPIEWTDISGTGELKVSVKVNGDGTRVSVNYIKIRFAQNFDMASSEQSLFNIRANNTGKSYVEIANAPSSTRLFDISDPSNLQVVGAQQASSLNAIIRNTSTDRKIFASSVYIAPEVKKTSFRQINSSEHNYVMITHPLLREPAGNYADPVEAFASYRSSTAGGGFNTIVVNIDELYDQFSYGEISPLSVINFMKYLSTGKLPEYLFFIGKGLDVFYNYHRQPHLFTEYKDLVPTAGYPASDIFFTSGLTDSSPGPAVATGRITAMKSSEVAAYLDKVKETEARPFNDLRRKKVLHLSGGVFPGEPAAFRSYLRQLEPHVTAEYMGGVVSAVAKQSTDLKLINIAEEVNQGLNLVTFFGHSSPGVLDFDIGFVTDPLMGYNNKGKYPVLLMNGCDAGAFFLNAQLFGENWINTRDKGAIGFIAHSSFGFVNQLRRYSNNFYEVGYADSVFVTKSLGKIQQETIKRYLGEAGVSPIDITHVQNMVLLGDPAVKLFGAPFPDYEIKDEDVSLTSFDEERLTAASDSFALNFIVRNYGLAIDKPLHVKVSRTLPDRSVIDYDSVYAPVFYTDTLQFIIRDNDMRFTGNNTFAVKVDGNDEIQEIRDDNNIGYLDYFIALNTTENLFPRNYSIVNTPSVDLYFQHTDMLMGTRDYVLEVDTTNGFDSPFKMTFTLTADVLVKQKLELLEKDSCTYFWRTRLADPLPDESGDWTTSSFTFINNGADGWAQVHFGQLMDNDISGFTPEPDARRIQFEETVTSLSVSTFGSLAGKTASDVSVKIKGAEYNLFTQGYGCRENTFNLIAFHKGSTAPYMGIEFQWFNREGRSCGREPWVINSFDQTQFVTGNNDDIIQYVNNIAVGDSVLLFNIGNAFFSSWPAEAKTKLGELGISVDQINSLTDGEPVVILGKKGSNPGSALVYKTSNGNVTEGQVLVERTITGRSASGSLSSVLIGPALMWDKLFLSTKEIESSDVVAIDVLGITHNGEEQILYSDITSSINISEIDASEFPFLKLIYNTTDEINLTAVQLKNWIVTFQPVTEGIIYFLGNREVEKLQEGMVWNGEYVFINVSNQVFEQEIPVTYKVFNQESGKTFTDEISIAAPMPGDTTFFDITIPTFQRRGMNDIEVFVNPKILPEQYYENNLFVLNDHLDVTWETYNPVIDVSVDKRYIENGDYVSSTPEIAIKLWDENPYLLKKDTTGIQIFMSMPCEKKECDFVRVNFTQEGLQWFPATDTSSFEVKFTPTLADGDYTLRVVGNDESGNASGEDAYEISFKVRSDVSILLSSLYPNPANDRINFDVVLTGSDEGSFVIQLLSMNGELVSEITASTNSLHIGRNTLSLLSQDNNGVGLPAGIYLYKLVLTIGSDRVEQRGKVLIGR